MKLILMLMFLLCSVPATMACFQCDHKIMQLHEDFILSAPSVSDQIKLVKIRNHANEIYKETSRMRKGVIDFTTYYQARTEYQSEFDRFLKMPLIETIAMEAILIMVKGSRILEKHLDTFVRDGLCPNKCGILKRDVLDCMNCRKKTYHCPSPSGQQDCGEIVVQADEEDQAVLNCFLPWHLLLLGKREYHYSRAPGVPGTKKLNESDYQVMVVTKDSSVVLNQVRVADQGTYRCSMQGQNGFVYYQVSFAVTVVPLPTQTPRTIFILPPLPDEDSSTEDLLVPLMATGTACCLAASIGLTIFMWLSIKQKIRAEQRRREEKENTPTTV